MRDKVWILGPCSLESRDLYFECLESIRHEMHHTDNWYMKASFDKANRTSLHGGRGPGLEEAKEVWAESKELFPVVNIKKGQWLGPNNLVSSVDKIKETNSDCQAWITDRGSSFGYHDLFVNFGIVDELKEHYDKVILDCTHSTQRSRAVYGTQGDPVLAGRYFISSDLFEYDGVFAETHPRPEESVSDGECLLPLGKMGYYITKAKSVGSFK